MNRYDTGRRRRRSNLSGKTQLEERRKMCAHALLNRPWIMKEKDPELYYWIKDQYQELREWFLEQAGFVLIVTRTMAKLDKAPVVAYPWMGFQEFREPMDYVFFTYGLWYLEGKTEIDQFLLTHMVEEIREQMAGGNMMVDWKNYAHRLSMTRALKKLKTLGVLTAVDGDESDWAQDDSKNALYECSTHSRYVLRRFPRELMAYRTLPELAETIQYPDTPEGIMMRRRHRVYRRFLLEPAVLDRDWNEEDLYYVVTQRRSLIEQMNAMFGFEGRRYREGLLFFHPEPTGEADLFPALSGLSDLSLLVAGELRKQIESVESGLRAETDGSVRLTRSEMERLLLRLREEHKEYWSKEHREMATAELADSLFSFLQNWGFGVWENETDFLVYPMLGRWSGKYMSVEFDA